MKRAGALLALASLSALAGCLEEVELAREPAATALTGDEIPVGENVPQAARDRFSSDSSEGERGAFALLYPSPPTLTVPATIAPITFEWGDAKPAPPMPMKPKPDPMAMMPAMPAPPMMPPMMMPGPKDAVVAYELSLRSSRAALRLVTTMHSAVVPLGRWRELLLASADDVLHVRLRALLANGSIVSAEPLELTLWASARQGTLYAWSTTAQGISRAGLESTHEQYLTPPSPLATTAGRCVGCHAVSRNGKRLLAAIGGSPKLTSWDLTSGASIAPALGTAAEQAPKGAKPDSYVYGSFDPTAARIAVTVAGHLSILNADSGSVLQESAWPMTTTFDYPSWSNDGRWITLVLATGKPAKDAAGGNTLARIAVGVDSSLGEPLLLASGMPDEVLLAPSYAPDDAWIVFEKRKGMGKNPREGGLWIVAADGGMPIELSAATVERMHAGASSPAFIDTGVPGRAFLLFAAQRPVGSFVPAEGQRQLFGAALDLQLATMGLDPSRTAFWLPFQQRTSSYQRVQWAPALLACTPSREVCDGGDDNCDGHADEDCCVPQLDTCGDGIDQDCDGAIDEGCGCAFREVCGNETDDDCDLRIDEEPCSPAPMQK